jgi:hypothetical protein
LGRIRHAASSASAFSAWSRQEIGPRALPRGSSSMQCTPAAPREEVGCCKQQVSSPPFALAGTRDKIGIRRGVHSAHIDPPSLERAVLVSSNNARAPTARAAQRATTRPPCRARRRRALQRVGRQRCVRPPLVLRLVPRRGVTSSACVNSSSEFASRSSGAEIYGRSSPRFRCSRGNPHGSVPQSQGEGVTA